MPDYAIVIIKIAWKIYGTLSDKVTKMFNVYQNYYTPQILKVWRLRYSQCKNASKYSAYMKSALAFCH